MNETKTFSEKHPKLNAFIGVLFLIIIIGVGFLGLRFVAREIGVGTEKLLNFSKNFVSTTDAVIVVAFITGAVSILGVVISSIVGKVMDYKYNIKKFLYDKREEPYTQFIDMIYKIMDDSKKDDSQKMTHEEMIAMIAEFSKGLTLWGSNRVVKKWLKYRKEAVSKSGQENLLIMEDIIYEIRRDLGLGKRLKKGDMLSFFINDVEKILK